MGANGGRRRFRASQPADNAIDRRQRPSLSKLRSIPPIYYTGGICSVLFVTTLLVLTPHIGIASTVVATIVGQLILSVILDHFGLFGRERHPVNLSRMIGSAGLLVSIYIIQKT